jgi:ubiquinone/menaquinone biosynthesis C-methylase UbiE
VGDGDFEALGNYFLDHFKTIGNLKPHESVLDVGCGSGRMALPLMNYLSDRARYEGFDVDKNCIQWCQDNITPRKRNFNFKHVDIFNTFYNPNGKIIPDYFVFPYESDTFDFIYLTSIFTHMLPKDMDHYFSEISRVLKKGGRSFITYFIINQESLNCIQQDKSIIKFVDTGKGYYSPFTDIPEKVLAYDESYIRTLYSKYGLTINEPVYHAKWSGREEGIQGQDVILAIK